MNWSNKANSPVNCYAISKFTNALICEYNKDVVAIHPGGEELETENPDSKFILYKFDSLFDDDIELIMQGKYSKISDIAKSAIIARTINYDELARIEGAIFKTNTAKKNLEKKLDIKDINEYIDEYESIFAEEEIFKT